MKHSIFISVGWSVALKATLLAFAFSVLTFFIFRDHLINEVKQTTKLTSQRDYNQFEQLRLSSKNFQMGFIEAISVTLRSEGKASFTELASVIEQNWESLNIIYGLEKLSLYSAKGNPNREFGAPHVTYPQEIIETINMHSEPFTVFFCSQQCFFVVGSPILLADNTAAFTVLATSADNLLNTFKSITDANATLVYLDPNEGINLIGPATGTRKLSLAKSIFNQKHAWRLKDQPFTFRDEKNTYQSLSLRNISDHTHLQDVYLFWSSDITPLMDDHTQTLKQSVTIMIALGAFLFLFLFFLLRNFTQRSHKLAETLPLLTEARYQEAEQRLHQPKSLWPFHDDIDRLFDTSHKVTLQLQSMNQEIEQQNQRLHKMAYRDSLTRLPNRQSFYESLDQQMRLLSRRDKYLGLLFIDIDGFKPINDTYGHNAGDFILTTLAARVNKCIRQADSLFRLAGDEFVIIASDLESAKGLEIIARKVVDCMNQPISWEGEILDVSLSVGGVMTQNSELQQDEFLHKADEAMYVSKNTGKGKYTFQGII
jgi:diguanylate cyclase (GGDEF)-like protein